MLIIRRKKKEEEEKMLGPCNSAPHLFHVLWVGYIMGGLYWVIMVGYIGLYKAIIIFNSL